MAKVNIYEITLDQEEAETIEEMAARVGVDNDLDFLHYLIRDCINKYRWSKARSMSDTDGY